jgi:hypothetical protein
MDVKEGYDPIGLERRPIKEFIKDNNWNICITHKNENYILPLDKLFNRVVLDYYTKDIIHFKCFEERSNSIPYEERAKEYINMSLHGIPDLAIELFNFFSVLFHVGKLQNVVKTNVGQMAIGFLDFSESMKKMVYGNGNFSYNTKWDSYFSADEIKKLKKHRFFVIQDRGNIKLDAFYYKELDEDYNLYNCVDSEYEITLGELSVNPSARRLQTSPSASVTKTATKKSRRTTTGTKSASLPRRSKTRRGFHTRKVRSI